MPARVGPRTTEGSEPAGPAPLVVRIESAVGLQARLRRHIENPPQVRPARAIAYVDGSGTAVALTTMLNPVVGAAEPHVAPSSPECQLEKEGVGVIDEAMEVESLYFQLIVLSAVAAKTTAYVVFADRE